MARQRGVSATSVAATANVADFIERCPTGIRGFDELCHGGFVRNSVNSIIGGPGTGKTIFLLQFLWNGITKFNENSVYLSFEPDVLEVLQDALPFGWDFSALERQGKCIFVKFSPKTQLSDLQAELTKLISKNNIKRVAIDTVSVFALTSNEAETRSKIFDLTALLKRLNSTVALTDEATEFTGAEEGIQSRVESIKFLSDSLTTLHSSGLGGTADRAIRIVKMRRTNHIRGPMPMQISSNGIEVLKAR